MEGPELKVLSWRNCKGKVRLIVDRWSKDYPEWPAMNKRGDLSQTPKNFDEIEGSPANTETLPNGFKA